MKIKKSIFFAVILLGNMCVSVPRQTLSTENPEVNRHRSAKLLSAFFGLDNALPFRSVALWRSAPGQDGMPLVFSHEIDPKTLDISDFQILTSKGEIHFPSFATFAPALEAFELRTVLLIGEFGNFPENEPKEITIVGELKSRDGQNFIGQKIRITPLNEGPYISYAEYFDFGRSYPYNESERGNDCPRSRTALVVRIVWAGGVRALDGRELGNNDLKKFRIQMTSGKKNWVTSPFQIADTDDNDNNVDLCISENGIPKSVEVDANTAIDPRGDANPFTKKEILSRW
ncbi:hypothetical protein EHQ12_14800 [Leptospira gomenensis]|uniref:Uncharacterized protein n=1 Tax=Leptospira gomenensis TaxID=2484974 RepID=A0A5F1YU44_9LEPT|nr:hypothetical protein [Leptospira gomenensis]TGK31758.1 hypothetical protein EHQ17_13325 [Leptospira gomenensis]TGK36137.1 hypothetical protein EHQ12_14800 [Leptospira gomenensis]TGK41614.1 hypothetical protein EHQ07_16150 [Leptospira gomenensis]TGK61427.1 hypothetical protein EHQ13_08720 [Leptospira gomenensis]